MCGAGFTLLPKPQYGGAPDVVFRAVRGHCEVHIARSGDNIALSIPVVRLGPDRPVTERLTQYLDDRNASGKGPGVFCLEGDTVWYRAPRDPDTTPVESPGNAASPANAVSPVSVAASPTYSTASPGHAADAVGFAEVASTALAMQETVERLGPKILNLLR